MPADVAQKIDVLQTLEPVVVVGHDRAGGSCSEVQETREGGADPGDVGVDLLLGEQLPRFIPARRIADLGRAAAHEHDGTMAGLLQAAQQHDLHQAADVQAVGGRIEADIGRDHAGLGARIEARGIRDLMNEAALAQSAQEVGLEWTHY